MVQLELLEARSDGRVGSLLLVGTEHLSRLGPQATEPAELSAL